jgi:hypothetical protein
MVLGKGLGTNQASSRFGFLEIYENLNRNKYT